MIPILSHFSLTHWAKSGFEKFDTYIASLEVYTTLETRCDEFIKEYINSDLEQRKHLWSLLVQEE